MRISVYVPCHDNETTLGEVLRSLLDQTRPAHQLLFVNDRSHDRSPSIAAASGFAMHGMDGRAGLAAARNRALELATGDVLAGFDADVAAAPDYLERLEGQFSARPEIAAIGGRLDERHRTAPSDLWRTIHMPLHHGDVPVVDPRVLFGATMAVRVDAARQVGGWNDRFWTHYEDVDICTRLKAAGFPLLYDPACCASHLRQDDLNSILRSFWNWNYHGFEEDLKDLPTWLSGRVLLYWNRYQQFRVADLPHPQLAYITMLLPWAWALRDLAIVRTGDARVGRLTDLVGVAQRVLARYGYSPETVRSAAAWLRHLAVSLDEASAPQTPLHPQIERTMSILALQSIPDLAYGAACHNAVGATLDLALG